MVRHIYRSKISSIDHDLPRYEGAMTDAQMEQAHREYLESRVLSARPIEIVHMLYEVAIDNLNAAISFLESGDAFARARAVTKAQQAVQELMVSLDRSVEAPFTRTLADLYSYVLDCIVKGHGKKSEQAFRDALSVLQTLAGAWAQVKAEGIDDQPAYAPEDLDSSAPSQPQHLQGPYSLSSPIVGSSRDWTG
jgi:flagellar secretion chaperone FliS